MRALLCVSIRAVFVLSMTAVAGLGSVLALGCSSSESNTASPADAGVEVRDAAPDADPRLTSPIPFPPDNGVCPPGTSFVWTAPGCGANAPQPMCLGPIRYACSTLACSCTGKVIQGCKEYNEPFTTGGPTSPVAEFVDGGKVVVGPPACNAPADAGAD